MLYITLLTIFALGYCAIIFEKFLNMNKGAIALVMAVLCWLAFFFIVPQEQLLQHQFTEQISDVAQIIFFLLAAMSIVELIDIHQGFKLITDIFYTSSRKKMFWFLILISFFMSSILDNLTSMIVMVSLLRKMIPDKEERWLFGSMIVISVNAGGAWTPIGDVTTTMMWISNKITTWETIKWLFLPSIANVLVSGLIASFFLPRKEKAPTAFVAPPLEPGAKRVFFMGVLALVMIPVFKATLGLPPFMGALLGLGIVWLITDIIHFGHQGREHLRMAHVFGKIDTSGILFFLGILLAIQSLTMAGILKDFAILLDRLVPNQNYVAVIIGLMSSIIDNVPLVAATFGMYDIAQYPVNSTLWQLIAYAAGTGGSILIIGSAAGVAFMGMEHVDFLWYLRRISLIALAGYFAGVIVYFIQLAL